MRPRGTRVEWRIFKPPSFSLATIVSGVVTLSSYPDLLYTLTMFRLVIRYKQSLLGWIWAVAQPLSLMIIYTLVFSRLARVPSEGVAYPVFVLTALLPWIFFSSAISNSVNGLVSSRTLLTRVYFPREIIVLSYIAAAFVDFCVAFVLLVCLMAYYGVWLSANALYAVPVLVGLWAIATGVALFLSSIQIQFRDVAFGLPLLLQVWMLATPVVYPLGSVPIRLHYIVLLNPIAGLIETFRRAVLHGRPSDPKLLLISLIVSFVCLITGYGYFKSTEATMADFI
jgi:lipopolysaccharide transport system permease protein